LFDNPISKGGSRLVKEPVSYDAPKSHNPISPSDLLALGIGPAIVADRYFIDTTPEFGHFCRHFWFKSKPVRPQPNAPQDIRAEDFVPDFHVTQIEICDQIAGKREYAVSKGVPEIQHTMSLSMESISVHGIGLSIKYWV
jgi:hypothetical protein